MQISRILFVTALSAGSLGVAMASGCSSPRPGRYRSGDSGEDAGDLVGLVGRLFYEQQQQLQQQQ